MEKNITSLEEIIKNANSRIMSKNYYNNMLIKPLKEVAIEKGLVPDDSNFESGIYLFEQGLLEYNIDKRTQLVGIFSDDERQTIRKQYFDARIEIAQLVTKKGKMQTLTPNLQKMLASDILISSISDFGLCYDFSKIKALVANNKFTEAENLASRDWFFMRTLNYFMKSKRIANNLSSPITKENMKNMDSSVAKILKQNDYTNKEFPRNLKVNYKNQKENKITNVNQEINEDLSYIRKTCECKQERGF